MDDPLLIPKIILMIISGLIIIFLTKARISGRVGNQFFIIMVLFWSAVFTISLKPSLLESVLNNTGLVNNSQFLFSITIAITLYLLLNQISKERTTSTQLSKIIRNVAMENFKDENSHVKEKSDILILMAAKNESSSIGKVIQQINKITINLSSKILVVDDGSTDNTARIARENGASVISHFYNLGVGGAVKTGFFASKYFEPKIVINIDSDGQHDPKYIPRIIEAITKDNFDLVYCSRFTKSSEYQTNVVRLMGNKFYTRLVNNLGKISLTDVTTGYRGIKYQKIPKIFFKAETNFSIELALRAGRSGLKIKDIPAETMQRESGQSQFHRIETFIIYNLNVFKQILNAYFTHPKMNLD